MKSKSAAARRDTRTVRIGPKSAATNLESDQDTDATIASPPRHDKPPNTSSSIHRGIRYIPQTYVNTEEGGTSTPHTIVSAHSHDPTRATPRLDVYRLEGSYASRLQCLQHGRPDRTETRNSLTGIPNYPNVLLYAKTRHRSPLQPPLWFSETSFLYTVTLFSEKGSRQPR